MAAISYSVPSVVEHVALVNAFRPYTLLSVDDIGPYLLGLFYIPFVIVGCFVLYLGLLIGLFVCRRRGKIRSACCGATWVKRNTCAIVTGLGLGVGVLIGSVITSALMFENSFVIKDQLEFFSVLFSNLTTESQVFSRSMAGLATGVQQFACSSTGTELDTIVQEIRQGFGAVAGGLTQTATSLQSGLESGKTEFNEASETVNYALYILSIVCVSLSSAMFVIALVTTLVLTYTLRHYQSVGDNTSCCKKWCSPGCWFVVFAIVLMVVFCSAAHMVALSLTDLCYPNVNDNINFLAVLSWFGRLGKSPNL
ncbi:hypothetical protein BASA81_003896 [Batrachochytrium salamandrivorans]|nr:hypothetical protein BASA81_003896 [Batrachochytrium salamandrivorans]